jgi:hypothetical protein
MQMQPTAYGQVTINQKSPTQTFQRFVDEQVTAWLEAHNLNVSESVYDVSFFSEEALDEMSCMISIESNGQTWRAWETADNHRIALARSLERLQPEVDAPLEH